MAKKDKTGLYVLGAAALGVGGYLLYKFLSGGGLGGGGGGGGGGFMAPLPGAVPTDGGTTAPRPPAKGKMVIPPYAPPGAAPYYTWSYAFPMPGESPQVQEFVKSRTPLPPLRGRGFWLGGLSPLASAQINIGGPLATAEYPSPTGGRAPLVRPLAQ